jgi:hypothetical protein
MIAWIIAPMGAPLGWHYWPGVRETVAISKAIALHEYQSAFQLAELPFWLIVSALVLLTLRSGRALGDQARSTRTLWLVSSVLAVAGMLAVRNIPFFVLVAVPTVSRFIAREVPTRMRPAGRAAAGLVTVSLIVALSVVAYRWRDGGPLARLATDEP